MITTIDLSQEILAIDVLTALKSSLKHRRKHILRLLRLYGDQALLGIIICLCQISQSDCKNGGLYITIRTTTYGRPSNDRQIVGENIIFF